MVPAVFLVPGVGAVNGGVPGTGGGQAVFDDALCRCAGGSGAAVPLDSALVDEHPLAGAGAHAEPLAVQVEQRGAVMVGKASSGDVASVDVGAAGPRKVLKRDRAPHHDVGAADLCPVCRQRQGGGFSVELRHVGPDLTNLDHAGALVRQDLKVDLTDFFVRHRKVQRGIGLGADGGHGFLPILIEDMLGSICPVGVNHHKGQTQIGRACLAHNCGVNLVGQIPLQSVSPGIAQGIGVCRK